METKNIELLKTKRARRAFTLIELLVVIAIIGIIAALITGLSGRATKIRKINRVRAELEQLETVIEAYNLKKGFYPPDNPNSVVTNQLFYELTGTFFNSNNNNFETINGTEKIADTDVKAVFFVDGFANSSTDRAEVENFFTTMKASQFAELTANPDVELLVVPVGGPDDITTSKGKKINPWRYDASSTNRHNQDSFDLWAELLIGGQTNIIGNWKE